MNQNYRRQIIRFCGEYSLLVSYEGESLRRIYCPFQVRVEDFIAGCIPGEVQQVTKISLSETGELMYEIKGKAYHYHHFSIP